MNELYYIEKNDLLQRIAANKKFISYFDLDIRTMQEQMSYVPEMVFMVFDAQGCLIHMRGQNALLEELLEKGITEGSLWTKDTLGSNAVTEGIASSRNTVSVGAENGSAILRPYSMYFAAFCVEPFSMRGFTIPYPLSEISGFALLTRTETTRPECQMVVNALNCTMVYHANFDRTITMFYLIDGAGQINIDQGFSNGKNMISHCNKEALDILGHMAFKEEKEAEFHFLEELIDPLPANRELWTIVNERRSVKERSMSLRVGGRTISCIITTDPFSHPIIHSRGVVLQLMTPEIQSSRISRKISNSALITSDDIIGNSPAICSALERAKILARLEGNILLVGESGVGKDMFAQAIHNMSKRRNKPFVAVNCGSLPRDLIASELFGYEAGAFTGAKKTGNMGKFELANGGTIFLDEIGELPLDMQANLLRIVEQKQFMRIGGRELISLDVKIISATNADLASMVERHQFRADLFYRLNTLNVQIPPLRERGEDILLLAEHFIRRSCERNGRIDIPKLTRDAREQLLNMKWRGNVRELQNLMECTAQLTAGDRITAADIRGNVYTELYQPFPGEQKKDPLQEETKKPETVRNGVRKRKKRLSREEMEQALNLFDDNRSKAADYLNVPRSTFYRYMEIYQL